MLPHPVDKISLKDKIKMNTLLLESGANIKKINCVRKHLSKIKGGNLAKMCYPSKSSWTNPIRCNWRRPRFYCKWNDDI